MSQGRRIEEIDRILARRTARLRAVPVANDDDVVWLAQFPLADEVYAFPLDKLRGVIALQLVRSVPLSPPHVIGALMFQGQLITALSLASLVGLRGWRTDPGTLLVVESGQGRLCAIDCEAVPTPTTIPRKVFVAAGALAATRGVAEVPAGGRKAILLVDLAQLVRVAGKPSP